MATLSVLITGFGVVRDAHHPEVAVRTRKGGRGAIWGADTLGIWRQVFYVTVQQGGCNSWTVYRRFDSFQRLGQQLQMVFGGAVPACPPRMFDLRYPDSVEKARVDLSMWMMQLLQHPPLYTSHVFVDFVSADANVRVDGCRVVSTRDESPLPK